MQSFLHDSHDLKSSDIIAGIPAAEKNLFIDYSVNVSKFKFVTRVQYCLAYNSKEKKAFKKLTFLLP